MEEEFQKRKNILSRKISKKELIEHQGGFEKKRSLAEKSPIIVVDPFESVKIDYKPIYNCVDQNIKDEDEALRKKLAVKHAIENRYPKTKSKTKLKANQQ